MSNAGQSFNLNDKTLYPDSEPYKKGKSLWLAVCKARGTSQDRALLEWDNWEDDFMTKMEWQQAASTVINTYQPQVSALKQAWTDAYAAFVGAFDTPLVRRARPDDYSEDARKRLREFNDTIRDLTQE